MSASRRNVLVTGAVIVMVTGAILLWHFVLDPWLAKHRTDDNTTRVDPASLIDRVRQVMGAWRPGRGCG